MNPSGPASELERACRACRQPLESSAGEGLCAACAARRTSLWVIGLAVLFFCFIGLPLLIQLLNTPRPDR